MTPLVSLSLPILLSAVVVFLLAPSFTCSPAGTRATTSRCRTKPRMDTLLRSGIPPGDYMIHGRSSTEQMRSPAFAEKFKRVPS